MRSCSSWIAGLGVAVAALAVAADATAQGEERGPINVDVIVTHIYDRPDPAPRARGADFGAPGLVPQLAPGARPPAGPERPRQERRQVDERVRRLDRVLRKSFRYDVMDLVERHRMVLEMDEVGSVELPDGRSFEARPREINERGVLMSVQVEGNLQADVRAPSGHLVVIGAEPWRNGKLVISIEPRY